MYLAKRIDRRLQRCDVLRQTSYLIVKVSLSAVGFGLVAVFPMSLIAQVANSPEITTTNRDSIDLPNLASRASGEDWPTFLGPRGDSTSIETGINLDWRQNPPRVVWSLELGESYGTCTISKGRCFQFDRSDGNARLRCSNSETGSELWSYSYPSVYRDAYGYNSGPRCSPIVDGNRVYIYGVEGELHCVRASDGKGLWRVDTVDEYAVVQNFFGVGSNPVVFQDLVIAMVGGSTPETADLSTSELDKVVGNGSAIVAFDKFTGKEKYRVSDELASYASLRTAKIDGIDWLFAFVRGGLLGLDPNQGVELSSRMRFFFPWRDAGLESVNASVPVVVDDQVFISETYGPGSALLRVRSNGKESNSGDAAKNYTVVWQDDPSKRHRAMQTHWNTAIHVGGYLYGSSGRHSNNAEMRCIELRTGKVMWSQPGMLRSSLLYADGHLISLSENGVLALLKADPKKFELVSHLALNKPMPTTTSGATTKKTEPKTGPLVDYPAWAAPVLSHGLLYVRGKDRLVCLDLLTPK